MSQAAHVIISTVAGRNGRIRDSESCGWWRYLSGGSHTIQDKKDTEEYVDKEERKRFVAILDRPSPLAPLSGATLAGLDDGDGASAYMFKFLWVIPLLNEAEDKTG